MTLDTAQLTDLASIATGILEEVVPEFRARVGAQEAVVKGVGDWATAADLALERQIGVALTDRTGHPVHGEEFGGPPLTEGLIWTLDPIDGTANYTARVPLTGISLALLEGGEPVVGLIWLPLLDERYRAIAGGPLCRNDKPLPPLARTPLDQISVTLGNIAPKNPHGSARRYPFGYRMAVANAVAGQAMRVRMLGSSAVELAWAAAGTVGAALNFGNHPWDNAAGALLVRSAGGTLVDLNGASWSLASTSIIAGRPGAVDELADLLATLGDPLSYL